MGAKTTGYSHRDVAMVVFVAAIFIMAVVYSVFSATTISTNITTDGTLSVTGAANASSTLQATGDGLFYDQLSAGASTNTPTTTFNVTGSGYFTVGLGIGYATTGTGNLLVNSLGVFNSRLGVAGTSSPALEFGVTGSGYLTGGLGVGYATSGTGNLLVNSLGVFNSRLGVAGTSSPTVEFGVTGSGLISNGLGIGYATTGAGHLRSSGLSVLGSRLGVNASTSPYKELGVEGSTVLNSGATTTLSMESTGASVGGCIEIKGGSQVGNENRWVRIYVGGFGATNTAAAESSAVIQAGGVGFLVVEEGRCQ